MKNSLVAALVAASFAVAATPSAQARDGIGAGGAAALGVLGGLAIGGAIASSQNDGYYPGRPVYRAPRPVYVEEEVCHMERRGYVDAYGYEHIRRVRVCE
ncbi:MULTISPECIES: hypothetical protein [unclassified Methylobacterium]|jgi:hypothetical protein|uniref:hypothetical protein n=1 Tax=unclassified Methylobacterium TaxID=2615210 RepID=UPI0007019D19|nr:MULTISPECIES: hypothetical protein [unclassified Methylobacterium]KQO64056.1 hypothetical protein ASF20_22410 [Methylobacterium sp. Leaf88]KQO68031.1 hypothetical protein ASF18_06115 [Methylobacterium sp. Leaf89]KQP76984.1 hypothetical protein ASF41_04350 [Methylobacterium sp. Leaf111]KQT76361.1 hypothetical protein ASG51_05550 [Methylobacterium sp. Leaf465]KQU26129.1 hypothetical protein ASG63_19980 [Methylobacterium sp. Leaf94]